MYLKNLDKDSAALLVYLCGYESIIHMPQYDTIGYYDAMQVLEEWGLVYNGGPTEEGIAVVDNHILLQ